MAPLQQHLAMRGLGMKQISKDEKGVVFEASWDELATMNYAIGDTLAKTDEWEFPILVGASVELAKALRQQIGKALESEPTTKRG